MEPEPNPAPGSAPASSLESAPTELVVSGKREREESVDGVLESEEQVPKRAREAVEGATENILESISSSPSTTLPAPVSIPASAPAAAIALAPTPTPTPTILPGANYTSHQAPPAISRLGLLPQLPEMPPSLELVTGVKADLRARNGFVGEAEVGISGYVGKDMKGVQGIIKQRFTDFMVYEVMPNGEVVQLVDITKPVEPDWGKGKEKEKEQDKGKGKAEETKPVDGSTGAEGTAVVSAESGPTEGDETTTAPTAPTIELPALLENLAPHALWSAETAFALLAHFTEHTVVAIHELIVEGRNPPPKQDAGWGARPVRDVAKVEEDEEAAMNLENEAGSGGGEGGEGAGGGGESVEFGEGRGGRGQGRDRGRGRGRDRGRGGRGGRGARGGKAGGEEWWHGKDVREVLSQVIADKEARAAAHKIVRELFKGEIETSAKDTKEGQKLAIKWATALSKRREENRERGPRMPNYIHFTLHKTNRETQDCLGHLARLLNIPVKEFSICGTKDKRAVTVQRVSIRRQGGLNLPGLWKAANGVKAGRRTEKGAVNERADRGARIGDLKYATQALELGMLKGNHFKITLRNVQAESQEAIDKMMESLRDHGFVNYFGMQRFGTSTVPTHITGLFLLQQRWTEAIDSILSLREGEHPDCVRGRLAWLEDQDISRALQLMPRRSVAERSIWEYWNRGNRVEDKVGALGNIPRNLRTMYVHAYQSYIWNVVTSERIKVSSTEPVVGDLVYANREQQDDEEIDQPKRRGGRQDRGALDNSSTRQVKQLTESDLAEYTIFDVVLPLPGWDVEYPTNETGELYKTLLKADGLDPAKMRREQREFSLPGSYRKIINHPTSVSWDHIRYTDPDLALVQSDEDRILNLNPPVTDDPNGKFRALKVSLTLGTSSYATMALREITRTETASWHQIGLTQSNEDQAHKGRGMEGEGEGAGEGEADAEAEAEGAVVGGTEGDAVDA